MSSASAIDPQTSATAGLEAVTMATVVVGMSGPCVLEREKILRASVGLALDKVGMIVAPQGG